jgi:tRNA-specific 2-thiouridylase
MSSNKKIIVGMSGGIDSAISAFKLQQNGWDPIGVTLNYCIWDQEYKCKKASAQAAKKVCHKLNIPHFTENISEKFRTVVISYFLKDLKKGLTPNPCIICNRYLKFKTLLQIAEQKKINHIATGHYARIEENKGKYLLKKGIDQNKDQSYYLSLLPSKWLKKIVFPLGTTTKTQVYKTATENGLEFLTNKDQSQNLCFVSDKNLNSFLAQKIGERPGNIVNPDGKVIGEHKGLHFYTIGQRKGIGLHTGPWYVVKKKPESNTLVVAHKEDEQEFYYQKINLVNPINLFKENLNLPIEAEVKFRYGQQLKPAKVRKKNHLQVVFDSPQRAITPGQFCVFYKNDYCLGTGKISSRE